MSEYVLEANARNWIVNHESHNSRIPYYALWREEDIERESVTTRMSWWRDVFLKFKHDREICELANQYIQDFEDIMKKMTDITSVTKDVYTSETGVDVTMC